MRNLELLIPKAKEESDYFTWATVTSLSPLRVRIDGEEEPLDLEPDLLEAPERLTVGSRVWCQVYGRRILLLGRVGAPSGAWKSYTPAWEAVTTNPTLGNGTLTGRYIQLGQTVHFRINLVIGSTSELGLGSWMMGLPTAHANGWGSPIGSVYARDVSSAINSRFGWLRAASGPKFELSSQEHVFYNRNNPFVWEAGDLLNMTGTYEAP